MDVKRNILWILFAVAALASGGQKTYEDKEKIMFDFNKDKENDTWRTVDDVVMGGVSTSHFTVNKDGTATFAGTVSLENYGGFASARTKPMDYKLDGYDGVALRVKGDGKRYAFQAKRDDNFDGIFYKASFDTQKGQWQEIRIPFSRFVPNFRGEVLTDQPRLTGEMVRQVGFIISDKQAGPFVLEIDWIKGYRAAS